MLYTTKGGIKASGTEREGEQERKRSFDRREKSEREVGRDEEHQEREESGAQKRRTREGKERRSQSRRRSPPDSPFVPSEKGAESDLGERSVRGFCLFLRGEHVVN